MTFQFDRRKAIESILYLARRVNEPDIYGICKLLYLVDKLSLEENGRFIFGETYCAMKEGATPSNAYDLLKEVVRKPISEFQVQGNRIVTLRDANTEYFSESDIECLDKIITKYGQLSNRVRGKEAHDIAWKQAWDKKGKKNSIKIDIENIARLFDDSDALIEHLQRVDAD
jgi:uncharacterized phage-associated protein